MSAARFELEAASGLARAGRVHTARGAFPTPCFMPVGTRGSVRTLAPADLEALGVEILLANAYHLMLRPGVNVLAAFGGLHRFSDWRRQLLTDSGGFQVFSLRPAVDDEGVTFRSVYDGSTHHLSPEGAVAVQEVIGADIQMTLDVCPALPAEPGTLRLAVERTAEWAARAKRAHRREGQALFGIVQGGDDPALRVESAERTAACDFDGYGIGGLSVGETRERTLPALTAALSVLPGDRARYLMGVGDPLSIVEAVALGVDMFDCVLPTRLARHGAALTSAGRLQVRAGAMATDHSPVDPECRCPVCGRYARAYLRHLFTVGEPTAARLLTVHNLTWMLELMARIRTAVIEDRLSALRREVAVVWGAG